MKSGCRAKRRYAGTRGPLVGVWAAAVLVAASGGSGAAGAERAGEGWPIFRGDAAMGGVAAGELPANPVLLWRFETEWAVKSSAVIGHGNVYIGSDDMHVYAIDLRTGEEVWSFETEDSVEAPPTLHGDSLLVGSVDGHLYSLDAHSGELKWQHETEAKIIGAANVVQHPETDRWLALVGSHDSKLHCLDAATGELLWEYQTDNFINATPAVDDQFRTVFGGCDGYVHVVSILDGSLVKQVEIGSYVAGAAALADGHAYLGHYGDEFIAVDLEAGEIAWSYRERNFPYFSSPAVSEDRVVVGGRDRQLHCLDRATGEAVWVFPTRGRVDSSPVIVGDRVVVGSDDGRLYIVNMEDGSEAWSYEIGDAIASSPAVVDGVIVVGADDGTVYAFGAD